MYLFFCVLLNSKRIRLDTLKVCEKSPLSSLGMLPLADRKNLIVY